MASKHPEKVPKQSRSARLPVLGPDEPAPLSREDTRRLLGRLHDGHYLEGHWLPCLPPQAGGKRPLVLHTWLIDAIGGLHPRIGGDGHAENSRVAAPLYDLARLRYLESQAVAAVCRLLSISKSEYHRRHDRVLRAIWASVNTRLAAGANGQAGHGEAARVALRKPSRAALGSASTLPFVGRAAEVRLMLGLFDEASGAGRGRLVLVRGEAGLGKTRLGEEIGQQVEARGGRTSTPELALSGAPPGYCAPRRLVEYILYVWTKGWWWCGMTTTAVTSPKIIPSEPSGWPTWRRR